MPPRKSNDAVVEQVKILFEMVKEVKQILTDMRNDTVSKEQLRSALELHEEKSRSRHEQQENDITIIKRVVYGALIAMVGALWQNFTSLFSLIIR